jgi:drug/metabolite transporter (DMT)-like permease
MSLESVFAALVGWLLLRERMSASELLGCGLLFTAVILSQLPSGKK